MVRLPVKCCPKSIVGLTLIEVLIALAIIAIAMTAVIKAASQHIRSTSYLQHKTIALWVGQSVINQARLGIVKLSEEGDWSNNTVAILGEEWHWRGHSEETANKHIHKIEVTVFETEKEAEAPVLSLESYIYAD